MKNVVLICMLFIGVSSFTLAEKKVRLLVPGKGIENEVTVDRTTKQEIVALYGEKHETKEYYTGTGESRKLYSVKQSYKKKGLDFYYWPQNDTVFCVYTYAASKSVTDKGIAVGKSTMKEVKNLYGEAEWIYTTNTMMLEYDGVTFAIGFNGKFPVEQSTMDAALNKKVEIIKIMAIEE